MKEEIKKRLDAICGRSELYVEELNNGLYRLVIYVYYYSIVCFGTCDAIVIKTLEDLDSYLMEAADREEILSILVNPLKSNDISVFSDISVHSLRREENYWVIEYGCVREGSDMEKMINKLQELGLCGENKFIDRKYFKLPVEGCKEFIGLLK